MGALTDKARALAGRPGDRPGTPHAGAHGAAVAAEAPRRTPPVERGERLATIPRGDSEELRVTWDAYEGRPYLSLRVWTCNARGEWWPDPKRGATVRRRELATFAEAVDAALERAAAWAWPKGTDAA